MVETPDLGQIAKQARERIEILKLFGWGVPLSRSALSSRSLPPIASGAAASPRRTSEGSPAAEPSLTGLPERLGREALLSPIREAVAACDQCVLCRSRTQAVFGVGDPTTRLMLVGEAPGSEEDRQGEPFVGAAGQLLNDIIRAMGLQRPEVYIANVIKCRPPMNRAPEPGEIASCRVYLERQIEIVRPEVILALGAVSARALLGTEESIGRLRTRFHEYKGIPVMPTYHPAYLLRNPGEKRKVWQDVQLVMARLGLKRPAESPPP